MRRWHPAGAASHAVWVPRSGAQEEGFDVNSSLQLPRIRIPDLQEISCPRMIQLQLNASDLHTEEAPCRFPRVLLLHASRSSRGTLLTWRRQREEVLDIEWRPEAPGLPWGRNAAFLGMKFLLTALVFTVAGVQLPSEEWSESDVSAWLEMLQLQRSSCPLRAM